MDRDFLFLSPSLSFSIYLSIYLPLPNCFFSLSVSLVIRRCNDDLLQYFDVKYI